MKKKKGDAGKTTFETKVRYCLTRPDKKFTTSGTSKTANRIYKPAICNPKKEEGERKVRTKLQSQLKIPNCRVICWFGALFSALINKRSDKTKGVAAGGAEGLLQRQLLVLGRRIPTRVMLSEFLSRWLAGIFLVFQNHLSPVNFFVRQSEKVLWKSYNFRCHFLQDCSMNDKLAEYCYHSK